MFKSVSICTSYGLILVCLAFGADQPQQQPLDISDQPKAFKKVQKSRLCELVSVMGRQAWKHGGPVRTVAVSPNGKTGVSGGLDGEVHEWDLATGECTRTLVTGDGWIEDLAYFSDGKRVLVSRMGGPIDVINPDKTDVKQTISIPVHHVALLPDEKQVIAASHQYPISLIDLVTERTIRTFDSDQAGRQISSLAVTPDGKQLLVGCQNAIDIFSINSGKQLHSIDMFAQYVASLRVSKDAKRCLAGGGDGTVRVINLDSGEQERVIKAHQSRVEAVAFTHGDERAFTGSDDYSFALFDLKDGEEIWRKHGPAVRCVDMTPDGTGAFTGSIHHGVMLWDLETGAARGKISGHAMEVASLAFLDNKTVTGGPDGTIRFWDMNGRVSTILQRGYGRSTFVAARDTKTLVISEPDRGIVMFDPDTGNENLLEDSQATMTLGVSWDGNKILGLANDRVLKEWNLATGMAPQQLAKLAKAPNFAIAAEPRTNAAVVFASDARTGVLELWDLASSQVTKTLQTTGLNGFITPLTISADGTLSVTTQMLLDEDSGGRSRAELALWNLKSGKSLRRYRGHSGRVVAACLSVDGKMVISISEDRTVRIYSTESDEQIDQIDLGEVSDTPSSVALSKDAKEILVGTTRGVALRFKLR